MTVWTAIQDFVRQYPLLAEIFAAAVVIGIAVAFFGSWLAARKIQPKGFRWKTFRTEAMVAVVTIVVSATILSTATSLLTQWGIISFRQGPVAWWVVALEYTLYFFAFDAYFYWCHRWMHREPVYRWVHKVHHWSTSPNPLTTLSETPQESIVNGGFVPMFTALLTVHEKTAAFILPTNIIMGVYVHMGYEFFPRWWNRSWLTKWFITSTFHDQHHKYFTVNFGAYTTIWDRLCGTMRPKYEADFDRMKARLSEQRTPAFAAVETPGVYQGSVIETR